MYGNRNPPDVGRGAAAGGFYMYYTIFLHMSIRYIETTDYYIKI
ncbi:hypothetical protein HMPREF3033_00018 [Veillonellaceae bacterium DNF00751]|nr:hypothetical protein HMPREF3033_00018 [Veillonellaceae bacterium DNF00751]